MIPVKDVSKITDTINGEKTKMTVRSEDWAKISGLLINLYSNIVKAVVREYSTNGLDAQIDAGVDKPIEVTLPSAFNSVFSIRDFGTGMTRSTLNEVYCMFGASTKDNSNDFNGSMGLGSKSALTYADAFTIVSYKDGRSNTAIVSRDEEGNGIIELLDEQDTTEPNGTLIQVPVKSGDENAFRNMTAEVYKWWPKNSVKVNGVLVEPTNLALDYDETEPGRWIKASRYDANHLTIVQGNVSYPYPFPHDKRLKQTLQLVAFVPNGSVMYAPSREALLLNKKTQKFVDALVDEMVSEYVQKINDDIASAKTIQEALAAFKKYSNVLSDGVTEWQGIALGMSAHLPGAREFNVSYDETQRHADISVQSGYHTTTVWLENFGKGQLTRQMKDAIIAYNEKQPDDNKFNHVIYRHGTIPDMFRDVRKIDWKVIKPLVKQAASAKGVEPTYDMYYYDSTEKRVVRNVRELPKGKKQQYVYVSPKDIRGGWNNSFYDMGWLSEYPHVSVIVMGANRFDKFMTDYPKSLQLFTWINQMVDQSINNVTPAERDSLLQTRSGNELKLLQGKTDDDHLDKLADAVVSYSQKAKSIDAICRHMPVRSMTARLSPGGYGQTDYLFKTYPLANVSKMDHTINYINMIYAENNA